MPTPSQTVGPFFHYALPYEGGPETVPPGTPGAIVLHGRVLDGAGDPVPDALVEIWHPDAGFGRCPTGADGEYRFTTARAPYLAVLVFARGLLKPVATRAYLAPDPADPLLAAVDPARRDTLVAAVAGPGEYRFDVHLQGERETVFLAY
ncbi:dioxygenase family protein [Actinomadura craniellae]|nr:protocatechuate 3,4-dioxygenase subunit alpha [Actinomadura craniellae]